MAARTREMKMRFMGRLRRSPERGWSVFGEGCVYCAMVEGGWEGKSEGEVRVFGRNGKAGWWGFSLGRECGAFTLRPAHSELSGTSVIVECRDFEGRGARDYGEGSLERCNGRGKR